jgi:hypothetical protein
MPPGYEHWLVSELSLISASKFGVPVTGDMMRTASQARAAIKHGNASPIPTLDVSLGSSGRTNIFAGE